MVVLGHVAGAHGVAGWLRIEPYTQTPDSLLAFRQWWLADATRMEWRCMHVSAARVHGSSVIAQLEGMQDRDAALALKGEVIAVPRSALPATSSDEIYCTDLIGLVVVNREGRVLGRVSGVTEHGAHPLLQVARSGDATAQQLIPYVPAVIDAVDLSAGRIEVDWGEDY